MSQAGTMTATRPADAAIRAMKPGLKAAATSCPGKAGATVVNAANEGVSARAAATRAGVSATMASLLHQLQRRSLTVLMRHGPQ